MHFQRVEISQAVNDFQILSRIIIGRVIVGHITRYVCVDENHTDLACVEFATVLFHLDDRLLTFRSHTQQVDVFFNVGLTNVAEEYKNQERIQSNYGCV